MFKLLIWKQLKEEMIVVSWSVVLVVWEHFLLMPYEKIENHSDIYVKSISLVWTSWIYVQVVNLATREGEDGCGILVCCYE